MLAKDVKIITINILVHLNVPVQTQLVVLVISVRYVSTMVHALLLG